MRRVGDRLVWTRNASATVAIDGKEVWVQDLDIESSRTIVSIVTEDGGTLDLPLHELGAQSGYLLVGAK